MSLNIGYWFVVFVATALSCHPVHLNSKIVSQLDYCKQGIVCNTNNDGNVTCGGPCFESIEEEETITNLSETNPTDCPFRIETASESRSIEFENATIVFKMNIIEIICADKAYEVQKSSNYICKQMKTLVSASLGMTDSFGAVLEDQTNVDFGDGLFRSGCVKVKKDTGIPAIVLKS